MTKRQKQIYLLRRSGRSFRFIASELGISESYARYAHWNAKQFFHQENQRLIDSFKYDIILSNLRFSCLAIRSLQITKFNHVQSQNAEPGQAP